MKTKLLNSMRVLLAAAGLCVGASAWADTKTVTLFSQNFESEDVTAETFASMWPSTTYTWTLGTGDATYGKYATCTATNTKASGDAQTPTSHYSFYDGTDIYSYNSEAIKKYTVEFDAIIYSSTRTTRFALFTDGATVPTTSGTTFTSANDEAQNYLFYSSNVAWSNNTFIINENSYNKNNPSASAAYQYTPSNTDWFHYKFEVDGSTEGTVKVTVTIINNETDATVKQWDQYSITDGTSYKAQGLFVSKSYYDGVYKIDNIKVTAQVETDEDVANDPSFTLVGISGTNRTYRIGYTEGETLHYAFSTSGTPDSGDYTTASGSTYYDYEATTSGTLYAYTTKGTATSETVTQTVTATAVKLAAPTFTRGAYSGGNYSIEISSDQTYVLLQPDVTLKYRIGDSGDYSDYSSAVSVPEGSTLYAYAYNANYTNSDVVSTATGNRSAITTGNWTTDKIIDFYTSTRVSSSLSLSDEGTFAVGTTTYYPVVLGTTVFDDFGITSTDGLILDKRDGLYSWNANINAGIKGLKEGQYVLITSNNGSNISNPSSNLTLCDEFSTNGDRVYRVNADGNASFTFNKGNYTYLYDVTVCQQVFSVSATIGIYGYASFSSTYALDFTDVTDATAYIATSKSGDNIVLTSVTGKVAAGTGLVLKSANGSSANISIPVTDSGTDYNTGSATKNYLFAINSDYTLNKSENGTNYVLTVQDEKVVFAPIASTGAAVKAGQAALWIPTAGTGARALNLVFDDETMGIGSVKSDEMLSKSIFNLNGQRISQPTKGLYIVNGKKVIIK